MNAKYGITNQRDLRRSFWEAHPQYSSKKMSRAYRGYHHGTDTRCAFVDYIDMLARSGHISQELAQRATLER